MGPPPRAVQNLPIRKAAAETYRTLLGQPRELFRAALIPIVLTVLLLFIEQSFAYSYFLAFIFTLVGLIPYTLFGVAWHRIVLLGPVGAPRSFAPTWQERHWRFLVYAMAISLIAVALVELMSVVMDVLRGNAADSEVDQIFPSVALVLFITSYFALYVVLRLSFVLPAVSVDESYRLADSWRQTRGQGLRLFLAMLLTALPLWIVVTIVTIPLTLRISSPGSEPGTSDSLGAFLALVMANYLSIGLYVTLVSIAFRICSGWTPCAPGQIADPGASGPGQKNDDT